MTGTIISVENGPNADTNRSEYCQIRIMGLTCAGEAAGLERRLRQRDGVIDATVNPVTEVAYITYDGTRVAPSALAAVVQHAGYGVG